MLPYIYKRITNSIIKDLLKTTAFDLKKQIEKKAEMKKEDEEIKKYLSLPEQEKFTSLVKPQTEKIKKEKGNTIETMKTILNAFEKMIKTDYELSQNSEEPEQSNEDEKENSLLILNIQEPKKRKIEMNETISTIKEWRERIEDSILNSDFQIEQEIKRRNIPMTFSEKEDKSLSFILDFNLSDL